MSSPMAGVALVNAIVFGVHGNMTKHLHDPDSLRSQLVCGAVAGFFQSFVSSPMELVKTRVQLQTEMSATSVKTLSVAASSSTTINNCATYTSPLDCLKKIYTTEGWRGLFRGQFITIARDVPGIASYFLIYEYLTRSWASSDNSISPLAVLAGGGFAGALSWVVSYPMDVVKSRLQADGVGGINKYKGIMHCTKASIAEEGLGVMFRGLNSSLLRAFPTNAATFAVVTWTLQLCRTKDHHSDTRQSWREVLAGGEALVKAAGVPSSQELILTYQSQSQTPASMLAQVIAASNVRTILDEKVESAENEVHTHCTCAEDKSIPFFIKGRIPELFGSVCRQEGNETLAHTANWSRRGDILSCTALWALTKHQHNLSIVL
ncbi:mitochondrial basic amino acids transporter isoform X2 [Cherax quadricarinatus]